MRDKIFQPLTQSESGRFDCHNFVTAEVVSIVITSIQFHSYALIVTLTTVAIYYWRLSNLTNSSWKDCSNVKPYVKRRRENLLPRADKN